MARPTMSKVLYTQQLGRGTRRYRGKEALYVIDVVDNYGAWGFCRAPWSVHGLLGIEQYMPWGDLLTSKTGSTRSEELILAGLYEQERSLEQIDITTFERLYPDHLSTEQLARELFLSTGTINKWLKKGDIASAIQVPLGKRELHYFEPDQVAEIRAQKGLKTHTEETRYRDFFEFIEKRDYTFSFKIVFMLNLLKLADRDGVCSLSDLVLAYTRFYRTRLTLKLPADRAHCPYNRDEVLDDVSRMSRSLLANPFEKFERKRFVYHCRDLEQIAFATNLWSQLVDKEDLDRLRSHYFKHLLEYFQPLQGVPNESELRELWLVPDEAGEEAAASDVIPWPMVSDPAAAERFTRYLPVFGLEAAAGAFSERQEVDAEGWVAVETGRPLRQGMFIARVVGHSMEPRIPNGAWCLFQAPVTGSRQGRIVLVQSHELEDPDHGGRYTVKKYESTKQIHPDANPESWHHETILLKPLNPVYDDIIVDPDHDLTIIAEFLQVLT